LRRELSGRGIAADVAAAATALYDDDLAALAAARDALRRLSSASASSTERDGMVHSRRLYGARARRGFDSRAIQRALWRMRVEEPVLDA